MINNCCPPQNEPYEFKIPDTTQILKKRIKCVTIPVNPDLDKIKCEVINGYLDILTQLECGVYDFNLDCLKNKISKIELEKYKSTIVEDDYEDYGGYWADDFYWNDNLYWSDIIV